MGYFSHVGTVLSGQGALDRSISDLELKRTPGGSFLVSSSGANGGLVSYEIGNDGTLSVVDTHFFTGAQTRLDSSEISIFGLNGSNYVVTGSIGSETLLGQRLLDNGNLGATTDFSGFSGKSGAMSAMAEANLTGGQFIFTANRAGNALDVYRMGANANHLSGSSFQDTDQSYASGIIDMAEATVAGSNFLLTLSAKENGVSCFSVNENTGKLTHCGSFGATEGLGIYAPTDLETVTAFGATYAIVASSGTSSLSVLKLNADGELQRADHILDTLHTRFGGVMAVETVKVDDQTYVIAGGTDDGLSLFILLPGGRLQYLDSIEQTVTNGLGDVQDIEAIQIGSDIQIYVTSGQTRGISQFTVDLPTLGENLVGRSGDQELTGTSRSEILSGGDGNDTLSGGFGTDFIYDGDGSDTLTGGGGGDVFVLAADGKTDRILDYQPYYDWIDLSAFSMLYSHRQVEFTQTATGAIVKYRDETIEITRGDNKPLAFHQVFWKSFSGPDRPAWDLEETHEGTDGDDRFTGSYLIDIMTGGGGDDVLIGEAGSDTLDGGAGNDTLNGGRSGDRLFGGDGDDLLIGEDGNDRVDGGTGKDTASLGDGNDTGYLGDDQDEAFGGAGDDRIYGQAGDDRIMGEAGDDLLYGNIGNDVLSGGPGSDRINGGPGNDDISGGSGNDVLTLDDGDDVAYGGTGTDTIKGGDGSDQIYGEDDKDRLFGNAGIDVIAGGSGNDRLVLGSGDDRGLGGTGDDLVFGGQGNDILIGEEGNDTLKDSGGDNTALGGKGNDAITLGGGDDLAKGGAGKDRIQGGKGKDELFGGPGNDRLFGGHQDDKLMGEAGNDVLNAGPGNDRIQAGAGNDRVIGGKGKDVVDLSDGDDFYIDGKAREPTVSDKVKGGNGDDRIIGKAGPDVYLGNKGKDTILGGNGSETIKGGVQADTLRGNKGKDSIHGETGNDKLFGGLHDDFLFGGSGNDRIQGDKGRDVLVGGSGRDTFVFQKQGGSDRVRDFTNGVDKLHIDINGMSFAKLKVTPVKGGTKIGYGAGEFLLEGFSHWKIGAEDFIFG